MVDIFFIAGRELQKVLVYCLAYYELTSLLVEKGTKYYLVRNFLIPVMEILMAADIPVGPRQTVPSLLNVAPVSKGSNSIRSQNTSIQRSSSDQSTNFMSSRDMDQHVHSPTHTRNEWLKRLASYASSHSAINQKRTPSSSSPKNGMDVGSELTEMILYSLHKCGEDECLLPLFKVVFAALADMEENKYTKRIEGRVRDRLLCRIIVRMVQYASKFTNLVLVCDDVQCKYKLIRYAHVLYSALRRARFIIDRCSLSNPQTVSEMPYSDGVQAVQRLQCQLHQ